MASKPPVSAQRLDFEELPLRRFTTSVAGGSSWAVSKSGWLPDVLDCVAELTSCGYGLRGHLRWAHLLVRAVGQDGGPFVRREVASGDLAGVPFPGG